MNVNKEMDEYFKKHDEEVIANAKPRIIEEATPKIIEEMAKRMVKCGISNDEIQRVTLWPEERIEDLKKKMNAD